MTLSLHPPKAYLNHAGASLMPAQVRQAMLDHLTRESVLGGYSAADAMASELNAVYSDAARLLGCDADEIALPTGNTSGWREVVGACTLVLATDCWWRAANGVATMPRSATSHNAPARALK